MTTALRNAFVSQMKRRFREFARMVNKAIVEEDVFGLMNPVRVVAMQTPGHRAFAFPRSADKVSAFMEWIRREIQNEILSVTQMEQVGRAVDAAWTNMYIQDSYRRGVIRGRSQMSTGGFAVPPLAQTGGINSSMNNPFHMDRLGLLFTRVFNDLKGITDDMARQISIVLTQGIADGLAPQTIAKQLVTVITGMGDTLAITDILGRFIPAMRRAIILARTEIIRAHAEAQLQEFRNWRLTGVSVKAEWQTAGDGRVCQLCSPKQGQLFTIEEASGMIPFHPQCRCIWVPFIEP